ncbi:MAG TPA: ATP-grasp domain-containing protein [Bacteroidota bacterium]|nr:ATP-grasp domain-containing protein [Bacteroidota bacterium]
MSPLRVALVFNQKKEEATQQSMEDDSVEPPKPGNGADKNQNHETLTSPLVKPSTDLYAEWDTAETIEAVRAALALKHEVTMVEADERAFERLREHRPDIVYNMSEGFHGISREAQIPAICEMLQIPYTGSDPLTLAICLDKSRAKEILSYYHVPTPRFFVVNKMQDIQSLALDYPCMVKPLHEGSSKGIFDASLVTNAREMEQQVGSTLETYREPALIEEYLPGREFTVAMLGNGNSVRVLPIIEIKFDSLPDGVNPIYSYEAKWIWDQAENPLDIFECPANLTPRLRHDIETICRRAYDHLRCRDWCRIDVRLDSFDIPHIIELNPLPGILPKIEDNSCFPKAARAAGIDYSRLIQTVLELAAERYGLGKRAASILQ